MSQFIDQKPSKGTRIVVAMSGGVDSSVAASLLHEAGYDVVGVTLKVFCLGHRPDADRACCSLESIEDARRVARTRGFEHYVFDVADLFAHEVIDRFTSEYLSGRTPNPCVLCNQRVKIGPLLARAATLGCEWIATGHYARIGAFGPAPVRLARAADREKDQSYVLWGLEPEVARRLVLPLGALRKSDVRAEARRLGLDLAEKPESQDICFVAGGRYEEFLESRVPAGTPQFAEGPILDRAGREVGRHRGVARYTVGQRRGIGLPGPEPLYVIEIDAARNALRVGPAQALVAGGLVAGSARYFEAPPAPGDGVAVQIRSRHRAAGAHVAFADAERFEALFDAPQPAVTPGQSAVLYRGDEVLGGGVIERALAVPSVASAETLPAKREWPHLLSHDA